MLHPHCVDLHTDCYSCCVVLCMGSPGPIAHPAMTTSSNILRQSVEGQHSFSIVVNCHVAQCTWLEGTPPLFAASFGMAFMGHAGFLASLFVHCRMLSNPQSGVSFCRDQSGCMGMYRASMCQTFQMARSTSIGLMAQSTTGSGGMGNLMAEGYLCPHQVRLHCYHDCNTHRSYCCLSLVKCE